MDLNALATPYEDADLVTLDFELLIVKLITLDGSVF